ncbi:MAG: hypothetical protein M5U28_22030, partial [Sandaracinaceae bacterium]|nr:hypothetical protein [Sandaracinaceae bacterium]
SRWCASSSPSCSLWPPRRPGAGRGRALPPSLRSSTSACVCSASARRASRAQRGAEAAAPALEHAARAIGAARRARRSGDVAALERALAIADAALVLADRLACTAARAQRARGRPAPRARGPRARGRRARGAARALLERARGGEPDPAPDGAAQAPAPEKRSEEVVEQTSRKAGAAG